MKTQQRVPLSVLTWSATERLLDLRPGERVLDIACGNGLTSRRLAAMGAEVVAFDFAKEMIAYAVERTIQDEEHIHYLVLDATDEAALLGLGESQFDAAIRGQPQAQLYFHRPLQVLLGAGFKAGCVLDGLEERAFPPDHPPGRDPLSWGANFSEIPPVLVARIRRSTYGEHSTAGRLSCHPAFR